jgi:hypothetical protein
MLDWTYVFDKKQLVILYLWLDSIPFTRKKRNMERDFSDGGIILMIKCLTISF